MLDRPYTNALSLAFIEAGVELGRRNLQQYQLFAARLPS
jgi:hypothetical protein